MRIDTSLLLAGALTFFSFVPTGHAMLPFYTEGWQWTLAPVGQTWAYQHTVKDPAATWDYGAELLLQLGEGYGHAVWFGASYREAAGFDDSASITPFNPRHIDSAQLLSWRWQMKDRLAVFSHWERWCYHEIDIRSPLAGFSTNAGFGIGTISPVEVTGTTTFQSWWNHEFTWDGYVFAGPFIHGGPQSILGNQPLRQGQAETYLAGVWPLHKSLLVEARIQWELLLLRESEAVRWRNRGDIRISLIFQRTAGNISVFAGHHPHDDFPDRRWPVSLYFGLAYRL